MLRGMSDLQCAATLLLATHGDAERAGQLGRSLRTRRLAAVYSGGDEGSVQTAQIAAVELGLPVTLRDGLDDEGLRDELEGLADLHRGETVLVLSGTSAIKAAVPALVGLGDKFTASHELADCAVVEVAGDADGWVLRSWDSGSTGVTSAQVVPNA